ncbi:OmpH family outer membrane protein [Flavobacteriaceae bacterium AU392]|nr:OmpH family outer membrane protein [Flavobacteriaceae bacterium]RKM81616.1 OmpH family outer membrane protein [Flavobacteriaceae bacterium AU392]
MKHLKTTLLAITLFIGGMSLMNAQSKIAHINTQELIAAMPEYKAAQAEAEKFATTLDTDLKGIVTEYQNKAKQYQEEASTKTDEENQKRQQELLTMEQSIQQFRQKGAQDIQKKQADLLNPISEKAVAAIQKVARAQGFQYVMDSPGLIMAEGKDLMADVKKELGI